MNNLVDKFENDFDNIFINQKTQTASQTKNLPKTPEEKITNDFITGIMGILG